METLQSSTQHKPDFLKPFAVQRNFFKSNATHSLEFRRETLLKLKDLLKAFEPKFTEAVNKDLGRCAAETLLGEVDVACHEIDFALKNLDRWSKPERVSSPWIMFPSKAKIHKVPKGVVLIMAPWNYPIQLTFVPLVGALAAGNTVFIKPSEIALHTSKVIAELLMNFSEELIKVVQGGVEVSTELLKLSFDHIFFTGSSEVGRVVMRAAAEQLTPVTLELGGKSPAIIDSTANLEIAARRIVWGKFFNTGQTCIAPDYLLIEKPIREKFLNLLRDEITALYGQDAKQSKDYGRIINDRHFTRLLSYLAGANIFYGGETNATTRYIAPTVLFPVNARDKVMQEEIFGPILPVFEFESIDEAIAIIEKHANPLSLYLFSDDKRVQNRIVNSVSFGGGCINDTLVHLTNPHLPFGGVRESGIGAYHGKTSFDAFSHRKGVVHKAKNFDPSLRYPPYSKSQVSWLRRLFGLG